MSYPVPLRFVVYVSTTYARGYNFGQLDRDRCNSWVHFLAHPSLVAGLGSVDNIALIGFHRLDDPLFAQSGYPTDLPSELAQISDTAGWCRAHMLKLVSVSTPIETIPAWGSDEWRAQFCQYAIDAQSNWLLQLLPS